MRSPKLLATALAVIAVGGGVGAAVALSDTDAPKLCDGSQVTYTQSGQTVVGDCWLDKAGSLQVAGSDGIVRQIPRSAVVTTPTTPPDTTPTTPTTPTDPVPTGSRPFSDNSPFNQLVGTPTVLSNSTSIVNASLSGNVPSPISTDRSESVNYDHPTYYTKTTDPLATVVMRSTNKTWRVNVPNYAIPAGASDHHIIIVAPDGYEYNLWNATKSGSPGNYTFSAQIGGRMPINGPGIKTPGQVASMGSDIDGATEAKFSGRAGIITADEMQSGAINHALFAVVSGSDGNWTYPGFNGASKADANSGRPHMGTRFYLAMTDAQIDASGAPAWERTIAKAAAKYGIYVGDKGGAGFSFMLESSTPYTAAGVTNPWDAYMASQGIRNSGQYGYGASFSGKINWKANLRAIAAPTPQIP